MQEDPDYIDICEEGRVIQNGLNALQFFVDNPVRQGDFDKALLITDAIHILFRRIDRANSDVLLLRTEFDGIVGEGVRMKKAMQNFSRPWWTRLFRGW